MTTVPMLRRRSIARLFHVRRSKRENEKRYDFKSPATPGNVEKCPVLQYVTEASHIVLSQSAVWSVLLRVCET